MEKSSTRLQSEKQKPAKRQHEVPATDDESEVTYGDAQSPSSCVLDEGVEPAKGPSHVQTQVTDPLMRTDSNKASVVADVRDESPDHTIPDALEAVTDRDLALLLNEESSLNDNIVNSILELFAAGRDQIILSHLYHSTEQPPVSEDFRQIQGALNLHQKHWILIVIDSSDGDPASFRYYDSMKKSRRKRAIVAKMTSLKRRLPQSISLGDPEQMCCPQQADQKNCGLHVGINGLCIRLGVPLLEHLDYKWLRVLFHNLLTYKRARSTQAQRRSANSERDAEYEIPPADPELPDHVSERAPIRGCPRKRLLPEAKNAVFEALKSYVAACQDYSTEERELNRLKKKQARLENVLRVVTQHLEFREDKLYRMRQIVDDDDEMLESILHPAEEIIRRMRASIRGARRSLDGVKRWQGEKEQSIARYEEIWCNAKAKASLRLHELAEVLGEMAELAGPMEDADHRVTIEPDLSKPASGQQPQTDKPRKAPRGWRTVVRDAGAKAPRSSKKRRRGVDSDSEGDKVKSSILESVRKIANERQRSKTRKMKSKVIGPKTLTEGSAGKLEKQQTEQEERKKMILYLRHKVQTGFLSRDHPPREEDMDSMNMFMNKLEEYRYLDAEVVKTTEIDKVLKGILELENIPLESRHNFKGRSSQLLAAWASALRLDPTTADTEPTADGVSHDQTELEKTAADTANRKRALGAQC